VISSASPRIAGGDVSASILRYVLRIERRVKRPGCVSEGRHLKVSSGDMASRVVERVPMLSQPRYL
jgi:hypothetical protein